MAQLNPALVRMAAHQVAADFVKEAIVPAGGPAGAPAPMDPAAAGAAPPAAAPADPSAMAGADPSAMAGAAPPIGGGGTPATIEDVQSLLQAQQAGGMGGKAGGKKMEQQVLDAKLYNILRFLTMIAEKLEIAVPPDMVLGPQPDPAAQQQANQELSAPPGPTGLPPSVAPAAPPMDPAAAAPPPDPAMMGKQADSLSIGHGIPISDASTASPLPAVDPQAALLALAAEARRRNSAA